MKRSSNQLSADKSELLLTLYFAITLETFLVWGRFQNLYTVPKVCAVLIGAAGVLPVLLLHVNRSADHPRSSKPLALLFGLQFLALTLATVFSSGTAVSFWGGDWRRMGLVTSTAMLVIAFSLPFALESDEHRFRKFLRFLVVTGSLAGAYGILQGLGLDPFVAPSMRARIIQQSEGVFRSPGPIGQPNYYANYLIYPFFSAFALLKLDPDSKWRIYARITLIVSVVAIVSSLSRGGIFGIGCGLLFFVSVSLLSRSRDQSKKPRAKTPLNRQRSIRKTLGVLLVGAVCLLGTKSFLESEKGKPYAERLTYFRQDTTGSGRSIAWRDIALHIVPKVWIKGTGIGMFRPAFTQYRTGSYLKNPDTHWETPHNVFLDRLCEQGIFGLSVFLLLVTASMVNILRSYRGSSEDRSRWALLSVGSGLVGALANNFFNGEVIPTTFYFYIWVALLFAAGDCFNPDSSSRSFRNASFASSRNRKVFALPVLALSIFFAWHASQNWRAESNLRDALVAAASNDYLALIQAGLLSTRAFPETGTYDLAFCEAIFTCFAGGDVNTASDSIRRTLLAFGIEHGLKAKDQNDRSMIALYYLSAMGLYANDARAEEWTRSLIQKDP